jgi:acyl-CoA synthetase (AMP-forming)/AMP-acid ligase II
VSHPKEWARISPDRIALIDGDSGATMTYAELDAASNRIAHMLRAKGLRRGDAIAMMMVNELAVLPIAWAAQRSGLFFTPLSWRFKVGEAAYILENSGAKALFVSPAQVAIAAEAADAAGVEHRFVSGKGTDNFQSLEAAVAPFPGSEIPDESPGRDMLYSSGTTGRPKGVRQDLSDADLSTIPPAMAYLTKIYGFGEDTINLTPAPLYHAGPLRYSMCVAHMGGTNIIMPRFDAERMLQLIEQYRVTHVELVPTMLVRLMQLPEEVRRAYDISSVTNVIHGSGPCAPEVKRRAIAWFGPILFEQYGGTEGNGMCAIDSREWLGHIGSVGKAVVGIIHIVDEEGRELPIGETGQVYFEGGPRFEYHLDPEKTAEAYSPEGWSTLGDIGRLDAEGYLWLSDRKSHMIISGGVNIYPQEAENVLINHPDVLDVAIFGLPDPEFGEVAVAAIHATPEALAVPDLEQRLIDYCKAQIASFKCPKSIILTDELPRHETGKIYKRLLVERYSERTAR